MSMQFSTRKGCCTHELHRPHQSFHHPACARRMRSPHASPDDVADFFPGSTQDAVEAMALLDDDGDGVVTLQVSAHDAILSAIS